MANILDYINWRGDINFDCSYFNEIDSLILSRVSYFPIELIMNYNDTLTIKEICLKLSSISNLEDKLLWKDDLKLINMLPNSERFASLKVSNFVNKICMEEEKQFSAATIFLPNDTMYISFRGTDNTIIGWKEDFNMGFTTHIPAQLSSVKYLEEISKLYPYKIKLGGHSKGGNLAIYSAIYSSPEIQDRIISIDNNDGPGFNDEIIKKEEYINILDKINTFIPQSSVVGMLLNHEEPYTVVKSSAKGIMQHDAYSWELLGKEFIKMDEITNGSKFIDKTLKDWIKHTTPEHRKEFLNILFDILVSSNIDDVTQFTRNWSKTVIALVKNYQNIDETDKQFLSQTINSLVTIAKNNLFEKE